MKSLLAPYLILTLLNFFCVKASFAAETLNFQQSLERAEQKSPGLNTLKLRAENAELASKSAWAALFPTVDLQATHTYAEQNTNPYFSTSYRHAPWSNQAGLSINENLYDNGLTWRQGRIADLELELQQLNFDSGRGQLLVTVAKAYYDYSLAIAAGQLQRQQIETLKTQFRTIDGRYRQGVSSNRDYLRIKAQLQSSEIGLLSQEIQVQQAKQNLRVAIGDTADLEFVPLIPRPLVNSPLSSVTLESTYGFRISDTQNRISEITLESARRLQWPKFSLKGSYNYVVPQYIGERTNGTDDPYWNLQAMVVLDFRLWDWGSTQRTARIAENLKRIDNNTQAVNTLRVREDLVQLEGQIKLLHESYKVSQQILKANQEVYDSLNRGYRDGKISYLDLITALGSLYQSRSQDLILKFNVLKSRLDWAYYEGKVDEVLKSQ